MHAHISATATDFIQTFHFILLKVSEISCLQNISLIRLLTIFTFIMYLNIPVIESYRPADGTTELQCFLNTYQGHRPCINRGIRVEWRSEHDTLSSGKRFRIENPSECFSKLLISTKPTDHRRKWKCCMYQNETLKASITHTTTVRGSKVQNHPTPTPTPQKGVE